MPNLESRHRSWSSPDDERWAHFLRVPSMVCVVSALWIGGIIAPSGAMAGTLDDVRARGMLICGVSEGLPGFSEKDSSGVWQGFDVDFCRAVAAAVFGDITKVEYRPLSADARFEALKDRRIDLLSRNSTWTMSRDLELGLEFAGISYFDGQGFLLPAVLWGNKSASAWWRHNLRRHGDDFRKKCVGIFSKPQSESLLPDIHGARASARGIRREEMRRLYRRSLRFGGGEVLAVRARGPRHSA